MNGSQANQRRFPYPECRFPLLQNHGFLTQDYSFVSLAAIIGGPVGMTGYVLSIANRGASIGAVVSAIFPTIGALLACIFLKDDHL